MEAREIRKLIDDLTYGSDTSRQLASFVLIKLGQEAIPFLIDHLHSGSSIGRSGIINILIKMGKTAVPALINMLYDKNELVRSAGVDALSNINDSSVLLSLIGELEYGLLTFKGLNMSVVNTFLGAKVNYESINELDVVRAKIIEFILPLDRDSPHYNQLRIIMVGKLEEINKRKNELLVMDIRLDDRFFRPPVAAPNEMYRVRRAIACR